ncbi:fibronectin type III domain-containing protein [Novilysobacter longmucuonensis]|uniref:fibronectin type III domain-containing protein n=1 Tax=Novilysobacter longmucuonensis TaxID=3098603 RepID=UPI003FA0D6CB
MAVVATAGYSQASIAFSAPGDTGGVPVTGYTVTSSPAHTAPVTDAGSPILITGLTNGQAYTFTVTADNVAGTGAASTASNAVTPVAGQSITFDDPGAQDFGTTPTLVATADSGLVVVFSTATPAICDITGGGVLTARATGACTINADQPGNASISAALRVSRSFQINAVAPGAPVIGTATRATPASVPPCG